MLILRAAEVGGFLAGRELELIRLVKTAYETHELGLSTTPISAYLHFPDAPRNRIIAKPSSLCGEHGIAGLKWVSSFPDNIASGLERSSAVVILNSVDTGRAIAIVDGSLINFKRTAASAALAAQVLGGWPNVHSTGLVGCGSINFEVAGFLLAAFPEARSFQCYDTDPVRAESFVRRCLSGYSTIKIQVENDLQKLLRNNLLISLATTAIEPHINSLRGCLPGALLLHISLRDIGVEDILTSDNVVDDIEHVCSAQTSIHLTEQKVGHRNFIRCSLGQVLLGRAEPRKHLDDITVFSPFGLAVLDLLVAKFAYDSAVREGFGTAINFFC
jgi:ornithine cyclodeaminase